MSSNNGQHITVGHLYLRHIIFLLTGDADSGFLSKKPCKNCCPYYCGCPQVPFNCQSSRIVLAGEPPCPRPHGLHPTHGLHELWTRRYKELVFYTELKVTLEDHSLNHPHCGGHLRLQLPSPASFPSLLQRLIPNIPVCSVLSQSLLPGELILQKIFMRHKIMYNLWEKNSFRGITHVSYLT